MSVGSWFTLKPIKTVLQDQGFHAGFSQVIKSENTNQLTITNIPPGSKLLRVTIKYSIPPLVGSETLIAHVWNMNDGRIEFQGCNAYHSIINNMDKHTISGVIELPSTGPVTYQFFLHRQSNGAQINDFSNVTWYYKFE